MKKRSVAALLPVLLLVLHSCKKEAILGDGPLVTQTRALTDFSSVATGIDATINYKIDPVYKVEIIAQQNILDVIRVTKRSGELDIDFSSDVRVKLHEPITINISGPVIYHLGLSGSGKINVTGNLTTIHLDMDISGSGNITVDQATVNGRIDGRISGSGNIHVKAGTALNEDLHISGSGNIDIADVPAEQASVNISGSGNARVNLSQSLDAHISGSGSIYYRGNPGITSHITGSGQVRPL